MNALGAEGQHELGAYDPSQIVAFPYAYWSSTQTPDGTDKFALCQPCHDTASNDDDYRIPSPFYVRPIRAFAAGR